MHQLEERAREWERQAVLLLDVFVEKPNCFYWTRPAERVT